MLRNRSPMPYQPFFASLEGLMVRRVGFEPTVFTLRDQIYSLARHRHRRRRRIIALDSVAYLVQV